MFVRGRAGDVSVMRDWRRSVDVMVRSCFEAAVGVRRSVTRFFDAIEPIDGVFQLDDGSRVLLEVNMFKDVLEVDMLNDVLELVFATAAAW